MSTSKLRLLSWAQPHDDQRRQPTGMEPPPKSQGGQARRGVGISPGQGTRRQRLRETFEALLRPGDRVALEGDNQKQADFLSRTLAECDPQRVHGLHMLIGSVSRPEHLDLFEHGIAEKLDLAYAGPQSVRIAQLVEDGTVTIGAIHTYVELYARMFTDLTPDVALLCAARLTVTATSTPVPTPRTPPPSSRRRPSGTGWCSCRSTKSSMTQPICPGWTFPVDWVDLVVAADRPFALEPLFTRDPRHIGDVEILQAMIALRGVYERHQVVSLNHGVGFDTAAIELILPTYGERLGLRGKIARNWTLNPHPTLIPAIESGWVESVHCFGGEPGMDRYTAARPDVFFTGSDGSLRSNRVLCQLAGQYAIDMFIGSSLQIDGDGNSSTVTDGRLSGFGGAPNMGHDPHGRRHASPAWLSLMHGEDPILRGRKLVVQIAQTFRSGGIPTFVETTGCCRGRQGSKYADPAGDDLRRRRQPRGHRRGRGLPVQGAQPGRPPRRAGGHRWGHPDRAAHGR